MPILSLYNVLQRLITVAMLYADHTALKILLLKNFKSQKNAENLKIAFIYIQKAPKLFNSNAPRKMFDIWRLAFQYPINQNKCL